MNEKTDLPILLTQLKQKGILLSVDQSKLKVKAPQGSMTPEIQRAIKDNKSNLIALIQRAEEARQIGEAAQEELERAPFHTHMGLLGGQFVPLGNIETPWYYESNRGLVPQFANQLPDVAADASPLIGVEHLALRRSVGLTDWGWAIGIIDISGPGATRFLNLICSSEMDFPVGAVRYTLFLNEQGNILRDVTIFRAETETYWILNGRTNMAADLAWLNKHLPSDGSVLVNDLTNKYVSLGLWGPEARSVLQRVTPENLTNEAFPYFTGQEILIGKIPARVLRISYAGELGYEIYAPKSYGVYLWDLLYTAGQAFDIVPVGVAAIFSLRIEKGYLLIGSDINVDHNPYEAGLGRMVKLKKPNFIGREASVHNKETPPNIKLVTLLIDDQAASIKGSEKVYDGETEIGYVTSGAYGFSVGKFIAMAWLRSDQAEIGSEVEIDLGTQRLTGIVSKRSPFDPKNERLKGEAQENEEGRQIKQELPQF